MFDDLDLHGIGFGTVHVTVLSELDMSFERRATR